MREETADKLVDYCIWGFLLVALLPLVAVTARPLSPQSKSLLDWITGPEGQDLLARAGYVPLR